MANVYNPTDKQIKVVINGREYVVGANETISGVPMEDAQNWKVRTHNFIVISEEEAKVKAPVAEVKEEATVSEEKEAPAVKSLKSRILKK